MAFLFNEQCTFRKHFNCSYVDACINEVNSPIKKPFSIVLDNSVFSQLKEKN